jgi:uncharacterized RDD family membrane protein YckC
MFLTSHLRAQRSHARAVARRGQTVPVDCPRCGAPIDALPCPVCGARAAAGAAGSPDYAGWGRRLGATLFDNLLLFVPQSAAYLVGDAIANVLVGTALALAVQGVYAVALLCQPRGQTLGNRIVGTRVRDATTLQPIGVPQALVRWLVMALYLAPEFSATRGAGATRVVGAVFVLAVLVDGLYPLVSARRQTWHDRIANTVVLRD